MRFAHWNIDFNTTGVCDWSSGDTTGVSDLWWHKHLNHKQSQVESCVISTSTPALTIHPMKGSLLPLHLRLFLSLGGHNGRFTMPVNIPTAPCTFPSTSSLRQPDQRQNELSRSMIPLFLLLELYLQRWAWNQTNQYKYTFYPKKSSRLSTISVYFCISYRMA